MQTKTLYQHIASTLDALRRCEETNNNEWSTKHSNLLLWIEKNLLPSGAGFDNGTKIDFENSSTNKLVFETAFHHMNDVGYYDGWTKHKITLRPDLIFGFTLSISGPDRNNIKDYIHETFEYTLTRTYQHVLGDRPLVSTEKPCEASV